MEKQNNGLLWAILAFSVLALLMASFYNPGLSQADVEEVVKANMPVIPEMPSVPSAEEIAALVVIPEVESADNELLNEFLESEFKNEYGNLTEAAIEDAFAELEDHDFRVVFKYLESLFEDAIEEDMFIDDLEDMDVDVEVTKLGLEEDEDKCATVTFEFEVEYEFEEGVRDEFEKDMVAVYNVCYDEGDFSDEEVELVSLI